MAEQVYIDVKANGTKRTSQQIKNVEDSVRKLDSTTNQSSKSIASSWDVIGRSAAAASTAIAAVHVATKLDALKTRLEVVEGSAEAADKKFESLRKTADKLGINFQVLLDSYTKFKAAADGGTLSQTQLNDVFMKFTRAAAAMKLSTLDTERVFRSLYQMASKGVVSMEELKNQLGDSLPKAMPLAAKAMDMTTQELIKQVEAGNVLAEELLPKLADAYEKEFGSKVSIAAKSVTAQLQRMVNAFVDTKDAVLLFLQTTEVLKGFEVVVSGISIAALGASTGISILWDKMRGLEESSDRTKKALEGFNDLLERSAIGVFIKRVKILAEKYFPILKDKVTVLSSDMYNLAAAFGIYLTITNLGTIATQAFAKAIAIGKLVTSLFTGSLKKLVVQILAVSAAILFLETKDLREWADKQLETLLEFGNQTKNMFFDLSAEADRLIHSQKLKEYKPITAKDVVDLDKADIKAKIEEINNLIAGFESKVKQGIVPKGATGQLDYMDKITQIQELSVQLDILTTKLEKMEDAAKSSGDAISDELKGMKAGYKDVADHWKDTASRMKDITKNALDGIGDAITDMVMDGKAKFSDLARSIVAALAKMYIMQRIVNPLGSVLGLPAHTGTTEVKHTGGFIGNLPSHHSGSLRQDERIAKLQVGEAVINRAGASRNKDAIAKMNAGQAVGGGAVQQTTAEINFNVQAIDSASFNNYLVGNRQTIENIINRSLTTNGSVRQTIKQTV